MPEIEPRASELSEREQEEAEQRSAIPAHVVHEAILREGNDELSRPSSALAWSGLAAGLSMGFSLVAEGLLRFHLPDSPWRPLVAKFGYSVGFLLVILGRQQLFTENTLTAILPLLQARTWAVGIQVLRLWVVVLAANLAGAVIFAWVAGNSAVFPPELRHAFLQIGQESAGVTFSTALLRGIFAGWLIAFMVWLMPAADTARTSIIIILTWLVALAGFTHIVAGSIEVLYLVMTGMTTWSAYLGAYMIPTLLGNILGGVSLVAAINHAQVVSGRAGKTKPKW